MKFERFIEARFGFRSPWVQIVTLYVGVRQFFLIRRALRGTHYRKRLIISFGPPAYLESIRGVVQQLVLRGWQVILCPEWETSRYRNWGTLERDHPGAVMLPNSSRALPLIRSQVFLSSVAGKHRYFPMLAKRVFYFHSLAGLEGFPQGGLDSYDFFLCATSQQKRQLTQRRRTLGFCTEGILAGGYPRYDDIAARLATETLSASRTRTLVFAPTYDGTYPTDAQSRAETGKMIIAEAVANGYYVVFRPHPLTLEHGESSLVRWFVTGLHEGLFDGRLDLSVDYFQTYSEAHVMVTDVSGSSVVFGAVFRKPVVFFGASMQQLDSMLEGWSSVGQWAKDRTRLRELLQDPFRESNSGFEILKAGMGVATFVAEIEQISNSPVSGTTKPRGFLD